MKKILTFLFSMVFSVAIFAHAPLISVDDNEDGTVYVEGGFSNGESASGIKVIVVKDVPYNGPEDTFKGKEIIFETKFGEDSSITFPKPATPKYEIYMNAGEGHIIGKKGPKLEEKEKKEWEKVIKEFDYGDWQESMTE